MLPEYYESKVNVFAALTPIVRLDHTTSEGLKELAENLDLLKYLAIDVAEMYNFFDPVDLGDSVYQFCHTRQEFCAKLAASMYNVNPKVDNFARGETILTHFPSGAGWRNVFHYGQIIHAAKFQRFDYGAEKNMEVYG